MLAPDTPAGIKPLQIIYLAFGAGVMMFVLATLVLGGAAPAQPTGSPPPDNVLVLALLAVALASAGAGWFWWFQSAKLAGRQWAARTDDEAGAAAMLKLFSTRSVLVGAMAEGVGLFAAVILFLSRNPLAHIGVFASLATLALLFPTRQKLQDFVRLATESSHKSP